MKIHMDCYGKYSEKNIMCQMCKRISDSMFDSCGDESKIKQDELNARNELRQEIEKIKQNCKYLGTSWDERDQFDSCHKNGNGYRRHADDCVPSLDCEKYCKEKIS